jgi:thiamine-phosphate pyrophosphorylase
LLRLNGLYAITDEKLTPLDRMVEMVEEVLKHGVKIVQLRDKNHSDDELFEVAKELRDLVQSYDGIFIIDDRIELAKQINAHGVHIGKDDKSIDEVRKEFDGFIGVSCYGSIERALNAQNGGADYVAFGSFYKSPTKPQSGVVKLDVLSKAKERLLIPICAIGGINNENISQIRERKPDMIALVSAIFSGNIKENIENLGV